MTKVRKAVIPAAGLGTRFLPATKALAKEMLPIVDKPTIQFIVEEALKSGIEEILVVTGKAKRSIEDHFDSNFELEYNLEQKGKTDLLKLVNDTTAINLHFIRQSHPRGLGDDLSWCNHCALGYLQIIASRMGRLPFWKQVLIGIA